MKRVVAALAATLLLAACADGGLPQGDPKSTLVDALRSLLETEAVTQTITIESDTDSLIALSEGEIDEETAQKILDSSITASGNQAQSLEDADSLILVNIAGNDDFEIRFVDGDLYLRADVASIMQTFGQDPAELDAVSAQVQGQPGFEWVQPALAGEWVVVKDAAALIEQFGAASSISGEQQKQLVNDVLESVERNATVSDEGEDDYGQHLRATMPLKQLVSDLMASIGSAAGVPQAELQRSLDEIPNEDLILDFWVSDDRVSRLAVDILQFKDLAAESGDEFPEGVEEFSIVVTYDDFDGEVEPVPDAVAIDTNALMQTFSGLMTGGTDSGAAPAFDCSQLKGAPPEVIELYAAECPELQK